MSNEDRTTSFSKTIEVPQDRATDLQQRYGYLSNTFDHARDPHISRQLNDEAAARRAAQSRGDNSWMVSSDQPRDVMRPPASIARPVDREDHQARMIDDDRRARAAELVDRYALNERPAHERASPYVRTHAQTHGQS